MVWFGSLDRVLELVCPHGTMTTQIILLLVYALLSVTSCLIVVVYHDISPAELVQQSYLILVQLEMMKMLNYTQIQDHELAQQDGLIMIALTVHNEYNELLNVPHEMVQHRKID